MGGLSYKDDSDLWFDGICNFCGHDVEQIGTAEEGYYYKNRCMNPQCKNHVWHYVSDTEQLDYYTHK